MASRKEQKAELRRQREERERAAAAAARRKRKLGLVAAGGLAVAVIAVVAVVLLAGGGDEKPDLEQAASAAGCTVKTFPDFGSNHVTGSVRYRTNPPTSGPHNEVPASDGAYTEPPPAEKLVHALEHGRVAIQYRSSLSAPARDQLVKVFDEAERVILTPSATAMPYEVAATAWRQLLGCPRMNAQVPEALRAFRDRYRDRGPERVLQPE